MLSIVPVVRMSIGFVYCYASKDHQGPVVQSIVSLTSSLRGQLVKCFTTLNTLIFLLKKMREASHIFFKKNIGIFEI